MSPTARGVYIDMLAVQWMQGPLPDDREAVGLLIGCTVSDGDWSVVRSKFRPDGNGCITNEKLDEVLREAVAKRDLYTSAGSAGGRKRAENAKAKPPSSPPQAPLEPPLSQAQATLKHKSRGEESREEETREDTDEAAARLLAPTRDAKPPRSKPKDAIRWAPGEGWSGITDADRQAWATAYPACDIGRQLAAMGQWLLANPAKAKKSAWRRFVTTWMGRSQDRGGDKQSVQPARQRALPNWNIHNEVAR